MVKKGSPIYINRHELKLLVQNQIKINDSGFIVSDSHYTLISKKIIRGIYYKSKLFAANYTPEKFDCDDYSLLLKGEVIRDCKAKKDIRYPYAFGIAYGLIKSPQMDKSENHAVNWFLDEKKRLFFIEPQTGDIFTIPCCIHFMFS